MGKIAYFVCAKCGTSYNAHRTECICGQMFSIVAIPVRSPGKSRLKSAKQLGSERERREAIPGFEFLGQLPKQWMAMVAGPPSQGKSSFCMMIANVIAKQSRMVLYWSYEEGWEENLRHKIRQNNINADNLMFSEAEHFEEFKKDIKDFNPNAIVIDSLNDTGMTTKDLKHLRKITRCPVLLVVHFTKDGDYKGNSDLKHESDIYIEVKREESRQTDDITGIEMIHAKAIAETKDKNRFGPYPKKMLVFETMEASDDV